MDYRLLGERIKQERIGLGLTQEVLAEKVDISVSFLGQIERSERIPSLETLINIAKTLNVTIDYLLNKRSAKKPNMDKLVAFLNNKSDQDIGILIDIAKVIFKRSK